MSHSVYGEDCQEILNIESNDYVQTLGRFTVVEYSHEEPPISLRVSINLTFISVLRAYRCSLEHKDKEKYILIVKVEQSDPTHQNFETKYEGTVVHNKVKRSWDNLAFLPYFGE
ncbi:unnamed protein product [Citrullus colocynthis]|uniref:Uncharacterized protein n=1 Tax=Citrullus colocynthis TaxID=252529 RepID=A0ABP0YJM1_9ROSI